MLASSDPLSARGLLVSFEKFDDRIAGMEDVPQIVGPYLREGDSLGRAETKFGAELNSGSPSELMLWFAMGFASYGVKMDVGRLVGKEPGEMAEIIAANGIMLSMSSIALLDECLVFLVVRMLRGEVSKSAKVPEFVDQLQELRLRILRALNKGIGPR